MATQSDVASRIVATLGITEPDLDTAVGSVTRKIIDAVAQQIADSYVDDHLLTYQYDIDSKIEADLDDFVQLFGISRIAAKRATGVVTFLRGAGNTDSAVYIAVNTQIASSQAGGLNSTTIVQTVTPAVIPATATSVEVPVIAVEPGVAGNVGAGLLTRFRSPIEGILAVTNINPLSGGVGQETDSELRARWKRTVFRSLAGTESMYLGIALNHDSCFGANVVGATKTHSEQIQIVPTPEGMDQERIKGVGYSSLDDVKFAYPETALVGPHLNGSVVLNRGYDYELDTSVRPLRLLMLTDQYLTGQETEEGAEETAGVIGSVFDMTFEYAPDATRNLPAQGITNRVDVWCAGVKAQAATQSVIFSASKRFVVDYGSPYCVDNYVREDDHPPRAGNVFVPLAFGPIIDLPQTLSMAGKTYYNGKDYWLVHDDTAEGYAAGSRYGIEWAASSVPTDVISPTLIVGENDDYLYNQMVADIQGGIDRWRLVGIDAQAHAAKLQQLRFNIAVMYDRNVSPDLTNGHIAKALQSYLARLSFGATIQVSDVLHAVHGAAGVDNVRMLDARDWPNYNPGTPNAFGVGIQRVVKGKVVQSYVTGSQATAVDVSFGDAEVPIFESFRGDRIDSKTSEQYVNEPAVRAQNTFYRGVPQPTGGTTVPVTPSEYPPPGRPTAGANAAAIAPRVLTGERDVNTTRLDWDETPSASGYLVYRNSETTAFAKNGPANGTFKENFLTFDNEAPGTTFYVHSYVQYDAETGAVPDIGISAPSNPFRPLTPDGGTGEMVLTGTRDANAISLSWTDFGPTVEGYSVFMDGSNNPTLSLGPANGTPRATEVTFTVPSGNHTFVVKGYTAHTGSSVNATYGPQSNPVTL